MSFVSTTIIDTSRMTYKNWNIGDLIWVPRQALGLYAKVGNPDFWKVGIITSIDKHDCVWFYYNEHLEKIHVNHIRAVISE